MEKTIHFGGKQVRFKSTMATMLTYKRQTGREYLTDVQKLGKIIATDAEGKPLRDANGNPVYNPEALDTEMLCSVAWSLAKTADHSIPAMEEWLDQFDEFPLLTILTELIPMIIQTMRADAKNA